MKFIVSFPNLWVPSDYLQLFQGEYLALLIGQPMVFTLITQTLILESCRFQLKGVWHIGFLNKEIQKEQVVIT